MKQYWIILVFLFAMGQALAESMSKSCSGTLRFCDQYGICTEEYFYLYAYQYVKFHNGELQRHRHRFNFRGYVLGEEMDYEYSDHYTAEHMIYNGPDFDLAIPWNVNIPIYKIDRVTGTWDILCP